MHQRLFGFWRRWDWRAWSRPTTRAATLAEPSEDDELAAVLSEPPDFERRAAIRHSCGLEAHCQPIALVRGAPWPVLVRDISSSGVALIFEYPLPPGTFIALDLPGLTRKRTQRPLRVQVVRVHSEWDGNWLLGCAFAEELNLQEVETLVAAG